MFRVNAKTPDNHQAMRSLAFLALLSLYIVFSGAVRIRTTTEWRSAYVYWNDCPSSCVCPGPYNCDYFSVQAYDSESRSRNITSGEVLIDDPLPYLYIYHQSYETCGQTYSYRYVNSQQPLQSFVIARNAQSARLIVATTANITMSDNSRATMNIRWTDSVAGGNCNCRQWDISNGLYTQKITSNSQWSTCDTTGYIKFGNNQYDIPDGVRGYISDSGQKTVSISFP